MGKRKGDTSGPEIHDNLTDAPTLQEIARLDAVLRTLVNVFLAEHRVSAKVAKARGTPLELRPAQVKRRKKA